jgi:ATPase subunit of ABC transporter with duplicated ATPase domains
LQIIDYNPDIGQCAAIIHIYFQEGKKTGPGPHKKHQQESTRVDEEFRLGNEKNTYAVREIEKARRNKLKNANSRKLKLEKMTISEGPQAATKRPHLRLPLPPKVMPELLKLLNASFGYPPAAPLVEKVDFTLTRGTRMVLLGPNGCGKSTVLKALTGILPPLETGPWRRVWRPLPIQPRF